MGWTTDAALGPPALTPEQLFPPDSGPDEHSYEGEGDGAVARARRPPSDEIYCFKMPLWTS